MRHSEWLTYGEEICIMNKPEEHHSHDWHIGSKDNACGKDFLELPWVRHGRWLDSIFGDGHDGSVIENSNDQDHEWWEVELPYKCNKQESQHNTDCDGNSIDCVVLHPLEDGSACQYSTDNNTQTWFCQHNIRGTPSSISCICHSNTNVCLLQCRRIIDTISCHATNVLPLL